jgi:hypothetical protein
MRIKGSLWSGCYMPGERAACTVFPSVRLLENVTLWPVKRMESDVDD